MLKQLEHSLADERIFAKTVYHNPSPAFLYDMTLQHEHYPGNLCAIASSGALIAYSGAKTGRSTKDKRIVKKSTTEEDINWGEINIPLSDEAFQRNRDMALSFLNGRTPL